ncbi:ArsR/SmtB family transcription factor [Rhizobium sp. NRK18]|uniref:ArsR/SmtB family transcription factor n=1 Tax=Rhizobium sp. NRK18 TaxID=2964667 RepID=UPI0021C38CAA|nr:metalloregulator ArsR/SmtB family transcription factor [Rhizobium sp. NRK18]MCQ2004522.1 metalloregulator ArsR/SmtB family transcription factor [Rhizobium sp. NRK18]
MNEQLSQVFAALGDPTRLAMIERLSRGEATVQELMEPFDISPPAISRHLKVLEQAGLITRGRAAQTRPCQLAPGRLQEVADWTVRMRSFWDESFDRMDEYLATIVRNKEDRT